MGQIVPWTLVASIGNGMVTPISTYLTLNFFAQRHTDLPPSEIKCHIDTRPLECQLALVDANRLMTVLAVLAPLCQFLTLPLIGVCSDFYGRKKTLLLVYFLTNMVLLFTDMFVFFNLTFWIPIALNPFINSQVVTTVLNSACVDILESHDRSAGLALVTSLDTVAYVIGLLIGLHLDLPHVYMVATSIVPFCFIWAALIFPETLPPEKRQKTVNYRNFLPWDPLPILWRTPTLARLCLATSASAFLDESSSRMMSTFYRRVMNWTAQDSYLFEIYWDISMIVWLTFLFGLLVIYFGEIGAMAIGRIVSTLYVLVGVFIRSDKMALANCFICAGPMSFALPAVAGLKSRLVGESEQGRMQAAIGTVYMVSGSVGSVIGGLVFEKYGNIDQEGTFSQIWILGWILVIVNVLGMLALCFMFHDLFGRTRHLMDPRARALFPVGDSSKLGPEQSPETTTYGTL